MLDARTLQQKIFEYVTLPYFPVLGLIHPDTISEALIKDVFRSLQTGRRPSYDKSRRWGTNHPERLLIEDSRAEKDYALAATSFNDKPRFYHYGKVLPKSVLGSLPDNATLYSALKMELPHNETVCFIQTFPRQVDMTTNESLPIITANEADQLAGLDDGGALSGFNFLSQKIIGRTQLGPTYAYFRNRSLIGAIGPLDIKTDASGRRVLLAPYFGVRSQARQSGIGRQLWQQAMNYAIRQRAEYLLLQAEASEPAEKFYRRQGLQAIGRLYTYKNQPHTTS